MYTETVCLLKLCNDSTLVGYLLWRENLFQRAERVAYVRVQIAHSFIVHSHIVHSRKFSVPDGRDASSQHHGRLPPKPVSNVLKTFEDCVAYSYTAV